MNLSHLKLPCAVLVGVALGWGGRGLLWRNVGAKAGHGQLSGTVPPSGSGRVQRGHPAGKASTGKPSGQPSQERVEILAAEFRSKSDEEENEMMGSLAIFLEAGKVSPEEFGPLMKLLAEDGVTAAIMELLVARWAMLDPEAALTFALSHPDTIADQQVVESIVREVAKKDVPAALAALPKINEDARWIIERAIVRILQRKDPQAALSHARGMNDDGRTEAEILTAMAKKNPLAAAAAVTPGKREQLPVVEMIAGALLSKDRSTFETWMDGLKDPAQQVTAFRAALFEFQPDPKRAALEAAVWLTGRSEVFDEAKSLAGELARRWLEAKGPPAEVAAWAAALPGGSMRDAAVGQVAHAWVDKDAMEASAWMRSLPQGKGRDNAVALLVLKISNDTPADAFEWARTVETPNLRDEALNEALRNWARQDTAAAEQAVETLPENDRSRLLKVVAEEEEKMGAGE